MTCATQHAMSVRCPTCRAVLRVSVDVQVPALLEDDALDRCLAAMSGADVEYRHLRAVLAATGGNRSEAAQKLGISERTLYRRLSELGGDWDLWEEEK